MAYYSGEQTAPLLTLKKWVVYVITAYCGETEWCFFFLGEAVCWASFMILIQASPKLRVLLEDMYCVVAWNWWNTGRGCVSLYIMSYYICRNGLKMVKTTCWLCRTICGSLLFAFGGCLFQMVKITVHQNFIIKNLPLHFTLLLANHIS